MGRAWVCSSRPFGTSCLSQLSNLVGPPCWPPPPSPHSSTTQSRSIGQSRKPSDSKRGRRRKRHRGGNKRRRKGRKNSGRESCRNPSMKRELTRATALARRKRFCRERRRRPARKRRRVLRG